MFWWIKCDFLLVPPDLKGEGLQDLQSYEIVNWMADEAGQALHGEPEVIRDTWECHAAELEAGGIAYRNVGSSVDQQPLAVHLHQDMVLVRIELINHWFCYWRCSFIHKISPFLGLVWHLLG